jgi:uncharacterized MAPEG superfamily protein
MSLSSTNYSFYTIPAAWLISILPHSYAIMLYSRSSSKQFDNRHPRSLTSKLEGDQTIDKATKERIIRAEGAQQNCFENLPFYAAAVTAGNVAGLAPETMNMLSGAYLASRIVYNLVYINGDTAALAGLRTTIYTAGVGLICAIFVMAGNAINKKLL